MGDFTAQARMSSQQVTNFGSHRPPPRLAFGWPDDMLRRATRCSSTPRSSGFPLVLE